MCGNFEKKSLVLFKVVSSSLCSFLHSVSSSSTANDISQGFFLVQLKNKSAYLYIYEGESHLKYPVCSVVFAEALLPLKTDEHFIAVRTQGSRCRSARLPLAWESTASGSACGTQAPAPSFTLQKHLPQRMSPGQAWRPSDKHTSLKAL